MRRVVVYRGLSAWHTFTGRASQWSSGASGEGACTSGTIRMSCKLELSLSQVKLPSSAIIDYSTSQVSRQFGHRPLAERGPATHRGSPILPGWRGYARREAEAAGGIRWDCLRGARDWRCCGRLREWGAEFPPPGLGLALGDHLGLLPRFGWTRRECPRPKFLLASRLQGVLRSGVEAGG